jgi:hypothetical protein
MAIKGGGGGESLTVLTITGFGGGIGGFQVEIETSHRIAKTWVITTKGMMPSRERSFIAA